VALLPCNIACPPTSREGGRVLSGRVLGGYALAWRHAPALFPAATWL